MNKEILKIFFKLKLEEIWYVTKVIVVGCIAVGLIFVTTIMVMNGFKWLINSVPHLSEILGIVILVVFGVISIGFIYSVISKWIKDNWKKAEGIYNERHKAK